MIQSYISIDLETTGLSPKRDKIIEIGAVKVIDGVERESFSTLVNPDRKLEERIVELTGISQQEVENAPRLDEVLPKLWEFLEDLPWVGHQILFDYSFLKKAAVDRKQTLEKEAIDTLRLARCYLTNLEHKTLGAVCEYYQIPLHAHRALEDARATGSIYQKLLTDFYQEENGLFRPQKLNYNIKRDTPATKPQKEQLYRLIEEHKLVVDFDVETLTRREASVWYQKLCVQLKCL